MSEQDEITVERIQLASGNWLNTLENFAERGRKVMADEQKSEEERCRELINLHDELKRLSHQRYEGFTGWDYESMLRGDYYFEHAGAFYKGKAGYLTWTPYDGGYWPWEDVNEALSRLVEDLKPIDAEYWNKRLATNDLMWAEHKLEWLRQGAVDCVTLEYRYEKGTSTVEGVALHILAVEKDKAGRNVGFAGCCSFLLREGLRQKELVRIEQSMKYLFSCLEDKGIDFSDLFANWKRNAGDIAISKEDVGWLLSCLLSWQEDSRSPWSPLHYVKDAFWRYVYVSSEAARSLGKLPKDMLAHTDAELAADESSFFGKKAYIPDPIPRGSVSWFPCTVGGAEVRVVEEVTDLPKRSPDDGLWQVGIFKLYGKAEASTKYRSKAMRRVMADLEEAARSDITVLLTGERGTGKDYLARELHSMSARASGEFSHINCAAIPETLAESELFGHQRGAFTGAYSNRIGLLERANGGTLFLNEIGELPMAVQAKLLKFLDDSSFMPLGGGEERTATSRLVAATNKDLRNAVKQERFRADLLDRLNDFEIKVPPLRDRLEDLPILVEHILSRLSPQYGRSEPPRVELSQMRALERYSWPGNVRQLEKVLKRALSRSGRGRFSLRGVLPNTVTVQGDGEATDLDADEDTWMLPVNFRKEDGSDPLDLFDATHRALIQEALSRSKGNQAKAARLLGVSRPSFLSKVDTLDITVRKPSKSKRK